MSPSLITPFLSLRKVLLRSGAIEKSSTAQSLVSSVDDGNTLGEKSIFNQISPFRPLIYLLIFLYGLQNFRYYLPGSGVEIIFNTPICFSKRPKIQYSEKYKFLMHNMSLLTIYPYFNLLMITLETFLVF